MKSNLQQGVLYIVATPIGNFEDSSYRQASVLAQCDIVLCERPLHSDRLFKYLAITPKRVAKLTDHDQNEKLMVWIDLLRAGQSIACISDAGTPMISDPGVFLVRLAHAHGVKVVSVPGPSAVSAAVSISGFALQGYAFYGFLASKSSQRLKQYKAVMYADKASVFFESPHRLEASVKDLCSVFEPEREVMVAKELTKVHEMYWVGRCGDLPAGLSTIPVRGEFVMVIAPYGGPKVGATATMDAAAMLALMHAEGVRLQQAVRLVASITGESKNKLYKSALTLYGED